jgi:Golgi phosphoprotein 3
MASTSGLTRRRGGGGGGGGGSANGDEGGSGIGRSNSAMGGNFKDSTPETSYESGENGHKIAYDPRDISESAERSKQPKLTLMEEVLLLGLKDKQVSPPLDIQTKAVWGLGGELMASAW